MSRRTVGPDLTGLEAEHLVCRDRSYGHRWDSVKTNPMRFTLVGREQIGRKLWSQLEREIACQRCNAVKTERYRMAGDTLVRLSPRYRYPEGFLIPGGVKGGMTAIHLEQIRRAGKRSNRVSRIGLAS